MLATIKGGREHCCVCVCLSVCRTLCWEGVTVAHTVCMSIVYAVHCYEDGLWVCVPLPYDASGMVCGCVGLCRTLCWEWGVAADYISNSHGMQ